MLNLWKDGKVLIVCRLFDKIGKKSNNTDIWKFLKAQYDE